jgi:hypothetical protein
LALLELLLLLEDELLLLLEALLLLFVPDALRAFLTADAMRLRWFSAERFFVLPDFALLLVPALLLLLLFVADGVIPILLADVLEP